MMMNKNIYFLGIGGIGMSALARYFHKKGCAVAGYDKTPSPLTKKLEEEGILIHYEDKPELIPHEVELVILTPAIPSDSRELNYLKEKEVKIIKRAEVLGEISRHCKSVAVAGSHGKTTVTSLISHILHHAQKPMSAFIGGIAKNINSNVIIGDENDEVVVMEADEFADLFHDLSPFLNCSCVATAALVLLFIKVTPHTVHCLVGLQHGPCFTAHHLFVNAFSHQRIHQNSGNAKHLVHH